MDRWRESLKISSCSHLCRILSNTVSMREIEIPPSNCVYLESRYRQGTVSRSRDFFSSFFFFFSRTSVVRVVHVLAKNISGPGAIIHLAISIDNCWKRRQPQRACGVEIRRDLSVWSLIATRALPDYPRVDSG